MLYFTTADHSQDVKTIRPAQMRNSYFAYYTAAVGPEMNTLKLSDLVTYDDLIWYLNLHVKAVASGTGAGNAKTWAFVPTSASDDLKSATVQVGYSDGLGATAPAVKLNGMLGNELVVKWDKGGDGIVDLTSSLISKSAATQITAFTGSLSDRTVTLANAANTQVYIDPTTIGTTTDFAVMSATFTLNNGIKPLFTLNNATNPTDLLRPVARTWKLEMTRYYGIYGGQTAADAEWDAYVSKAERKVRILTTGPAISGGGNYTITADFYGVYTAMDNAETDDFGTQKFTLEPYYDTTATTDFSFTVVNTSGTIT
jgi:hypothetical protein